MITVHTKIDNSTGAYTAIVQAFQGHRFPGISSLASFGYKAEVPASYRYNLTIQQGVAGRKSTS